ncbi:FliM/FliN family flagellar motor switch protein [Pseudomonas sp. nanlin1]|uniref:FliM/FliN family flagellar motor switch protein n=1 Tax=Pseudomonas sp. nanlin1 TaxID=3040605 RepID=UPI00388EE948
MTTQALPLRRVSAAQARLARHLAGEPWMAFNVAGQAGRLSLRASQRTLTAEPLQWFECTLGPLGLSDAQPVLAAWSSNPTFVGADSQTQNAWFWPLYNAGLASELATLLGALQPRGAPSAADGPISYCELTLELPQGRIHSLLALPSAGLGEGFERVPWNAKPPADHSGMTLAFAVRLGRLNLPQQQVQTLRAGDVLCPAEADFDSTGNGLLSLGPRRLQVRVLEQAERLQLQVVQIEENAVVEDNPLDYPAQPADEVWGDDPAYAFSEDSDAAAQGEPFAAPERRPEPLTETFADLSLPLTLRCGELRLSLGELAALAPGAVLEVPGVTPGLAGLYYGERRLAQGELVDVEGRLGLQITQVDERR